MPLDRREFLLLLSATGAASALTAHALPSSGAAVGAEPGRIPNEYSLLLPGEKEALAKPPTVSGFSGGVVSAVHSGTTQQLRPGEHISGWMLLETLDINGTTTAVFEKHVTHRGAIAYVTELGGTIALIPKGVGDLSKIRPRPLNTGAGVKLERPMRMQPGPDVTGEFLLRSDQDPCYENVAALGPEYIGWSLVSSDGAGPERSIYLQPDCLTRELHPSTQAAWAPDIEGTLFDPNDYFPFAAPEQYAYQPGYSKRTLLGG
ncbi:MAG: hypothetical protein INR71_13585, partial [Terriglobus roseus]|nr:hypothetical protein [Terriglobus roseus]